MATPATAELPFPATILVSDSTQIGCEVLCYVLSSSPHGFQTVAAGVSSKSILKVAAENKPEIALLSLVLQDGPTAGLLLLKEFHQLNNGIACVLLMDKADPEIAVEAYRRGAKGVFLRSSPLSLLKSCIEVLRQGKIWIRDEDLLRLLEVFSTAAPLSFQNAKGEELLSGREREIVALLTQGLSNREIAQQANISEHTVKNYMLRIFDKLGVSCRAELIIYALHRASTQQRLAAGNPASMRTASVTSSGLRNSDSAVSQK